MGLFDRLLLRAAKSGHGVHTVTQTHVKQSFKIKVPAAKAPKAEAALRDWIQDKQLPVALSSHPSGEFVEFDFQNETDSDGPPGRDPALHASKMAEEIQRVLQDALKQDS
jgi:hypothetical protein